MVQLTGKELIQKHRALDEALLEFELWKLAQWNQIQEQKAAKREARNLKDSLILRVDYSKLYQQK